MRLCSYPAPSSTPQVLEFFRRMGMPHSYKAPLMLVEALILDQYSAKEGGRAGGPVFHIRGLCVAHVYT